MQQLDFFKEWETLDAHPNKRSEIDRCVLEIGKALNINPFSIRVLRHTFVKRPTKEYVAFRGHKPYPTKLKQYLLVSRTCALSSVGAVSGHLL